MSFSAVIVMIVSIAALWGVATITLVHSMRQEGRKLSLLQEQGNFEPFSPAAQHDIEEWLARNPEGEKAREMRELLELQNQARRNNSRHFYHWANS
ncbi:hypothetical protein [Salinicola peritrichatus]|uniref:hypothetical protein n=1 Tax=Salinicola peritrichatus TaxID=1267424 RepID=UPI000DA183F2|nr:hypothetical protein [Salinicola peritrichatus]